MNQMIQMGSPLSMDKLNMQAAVQNEDLIFNQTPTSSDL